MAKLYFKYGTMASSKTANLLITKFNYEERGMKVCLIKPALDNRDGVSITKSRIGLESKVDYLINNDEKIIIDLDKYDVILVDECQFLSEKQIDDLHDIAIDHNIPVICYGLLTDFKTHLFNGSKRLIEVAESIHEIKSICSCGNKANVNARFDHNGNIIDYGEQVEIGGNDKYLPMCYRCYKSIINDRRAL